MTSVGQWANERNQPRVWQRTAITHHCRLAIETMHPMFRHVVMPYCYILTVNSGYE